MGASLAAQKLGIVGCFTGSSSGGSRSGGSSGPIPPAADQYKPSPPRDSGGGLSTGATVGIGAGCAVLLGAAVSGFMWFNRSKKGSYSNVDV